MNKYTINDITRASGGFAMLAVDQREAMRMMFAAAGAPAPVADSVLTDFKVNAAKTLSPYASAILVDQQFCYRQVVEQNAIAKSCAMIVAADEFIPGNGIPVDSVVIDRKINPQQIKQDEMCIRDSSNTAPGVSSPKISTCICTRALRPRARRSRSPLKAPRSATA